MSDTIRNQLEVNEFVAGEKIAQGHMDKIYGDLGLITDRSKACQAFDCQITKEQKTYKIEEKFRQDDYGDFGVELFQCVMEPQLGWYYHVDADYINYVICDHWEPRYGYWVRWRTFKKWMINHLTYNKKPEVFVSPLGIGLSLNVAFTWALLTAEKIADRWEYTDG